VFAPEVDKTAGSRSGLRPGGYNIGINVGTVSGQTVDHVHVHLIPRYPGDVADPFGGVRNVIPGRGRYFGPRSQEGCHQ
jgi:diadenosine tetraphosphate (Ap4A) HIT family hydrolase